MSHQNRTDPKLDQVNHCFNMILIQLNTQNYYLTIRNPAATTTAFIFISKSLGKLIPRFSASVKPDKPDHFFDIFPTLVEPSPDKT